jgi:hypothetical protein
MTRFARLSLAAAALAVLAACSGGSAPRTAAPAPEAALSAPPAPETGQSGYGTANTGGTYPYGAVPPAGAEAPAAAGQHGAGAEEGVIVHGPDGSVWIKPGATTERYRADVDSCYAYAQAQIAHDARIESDSGAAFPDANDGFGLSALRGRMSNFERANRRPVLFSKCMEAKGYIRR